MADGEKVAEKLDGDQSVGAAHAGTVWLPGHTFMIFHIFFDVSIICHITTTC
jgi:hypothetical protein